MIEKASSCELRTALQGHLRETRLQITRLERIFAAIAKDPDTNSNAILDAMMSAANDSASPIEDSPLRDAALIANGHVRTR